MAQDIEISFKFNGVDQAVGSVQELADAMANASKQQQKIDKNTGFIGKLKKGFQSLTGAAGKVAKGIGGIFSAIGKLGIVTTVLGALSGAFKGNQAVVDAFSKVMTALEIVFSKVAGAVVRIIGEQSKLNGGFEKTGKVVGGLVTGALNLLLGAFQGIEWVVLQVQKAWEGSIFGSGDESKIKSLNERITELNGEMAKTGEAILQAGSDVVTNFVGAVQEVASTASAVVQGVTEEIQNTDLGEVLKDSEKLVALRKAAAIADAERQRIQLEFQQREEVLRQLRDDENRSLADRQKSNEELLGLLEKQAKLEAEQIKTKIAAAQADYAQQNTTENLVALKQAQLELTDLQERLEGQRSEALSNQNALAKEALDIARMNQEANLTMLEEQLAANVELQGSEDAKLRMQLDNINILRQARLAAIDDELANATEGTARYEELVNQRKQVEQTAAIETAAVQKQLDDEALARKKANEQKVLDISKMGLTAISDLAEAFAGDDEKRQKKAFELNKALQIGTTTIDTYSAIVAALGDKTVPGPLRIAQAVAIGIAGFANVAKIKAQKWKGSSGSQSPVKPQSVNAQPLDLAGAASNVTGPLNVQQVGSQSVVKAYVVSGEMTSQQEADKKIQNLSRLGN
jgi:hypothetical protein